MAKEACANDIALNLHDVRKRIQISVEKAKTGLSANSSVQEVQLVAVSKTKPLELLLAAYEQGNQRLFGENYAQELIDKALKMPPDVHWHFIGTLQSNKVNGLIKTVYPIVASLTIETVSSLKLAKKLNAAMEGLQTDASVTSSDETPQQRQSFLLPIFVQVNTSREDTKGGVEPDEVVGLCREITKSCDHLVISGLMTIGAEGDLSCFDCLVQCRDNVAEALNIPIKDLALSMGMSGDFEEAIIKGATHVRIGSTIFGARDYSKN